jgi:hypothetical protein
LQRLRQRFNAEATEHTEAARERAGWRSGWSPRRPSWIVWAGDAEDANDRDHKRSLLQVVLVIPVARIFHTARSAAAISPN